MGDCPCTGKAYIDSRGNEKRLKEPQPSDCRTCRYKCNTKFTEEDRGRICREYWQLEDYARQKNFILSNVDRFDVQRQRSRGERKRTKTQSVVYSFKNGSEVVRVCKRFFLKTIDISHGPVYGFRIYCITWTHAMSYPAARSFQQEYSAIRLQLRVNVCGSPSSCHKDDGDIQVSSLINAMGRQGENIFK